VVVTSRDKLAGLVAADGAYPLSVDVLPHPDAAELLARRLGRERLASEPQAASELIELCARLPLALAIVAAHAALSPALALHELAGCHLVTEFPPGRFAFHDMLRAYAAERAAAEDGEAERRSAIHRMLDHYLHTAHAAALLSPHFDALALVPPQPGVSREDA